MGKDTNGRNRHHSPYNKDIKKSGSNRSLYQPRRDADKQYPQRRAFEEPKLYLNESQVGITQFVTSGKGFTGVVKARFSDFHVNEIDPSGKVLQLNDLSIPQPIDDGLSEEGLLEAKGELNEVITPEVWAEIEALAKLNRNDSNAKESIEVEVSHLDKEQRTKIHKVLKKLYEGKLVTTTLNNSQDGDEERKFIKIYKPKKGPGETRYNWNFPGEYVHFLVHKENMDTSEVAAIMASRLRLKASQVNYCGTKDKRAKTTQKFCIKRRPPSQILSSIDAIHNVKVGNFEFSQEVLKLGQLKGNRFRIALRYVCAENAEIEAALQEVKERGFINYYGLQRFGNSASVPTYEVGIALIKCDYKLATELILKPRENDNPFLRAIREEWWKNRNSSVAADMFRSSKYIEKRLLDGLARYGENDYAGALSRIPRNMLLLYPHAFQSLIFNRIASRRIKEFGLELIPGDLVFCNKDEQDISGIEDLTTMQEEDEPLVPKEHAENQNTSEKQMNANEDLTSTSTASDSVYIRKVKSLTGEEVASGEWTIFDVVLPLPGFSVTLPQNEVGKWYVELLQEHGLSIDKLKHNVKTYSMTGAYRRLLVKPEQMKWEFKKYDKPSDTLIASDWEQLKNKQVLCSAGKEGKFKAVLLDLCLPPSTYATMFLRELLKAGTSAAAQSQLEQQEMKKHEVSFAAEVPQPEVAAPEKRKSDEGNNCCIDDGEYDSKKIKADEAEDEKMPK